MCSIWQKLLNGEPVSKGDAGQLNVQESLRNKAKHDRKHPLDTVYRPEHDLPVSERIRRQALRKKNRDNQRD